MPSNGGGYFRLDSWIMANIVQLGTQRFCSRFLNGKNDPGGGLGDQMMRSARTGCVSNAAGSARRPSSRENENRPIIAARAALVELSCDLLNWLMQQEKIPWEREAQDAREVHGIRLDPPDYGKDLLHDACAHILTQRRKFAKWLNDDDGETVANALLILIARVIWMLSHQLESQGRASEPADAPRERRDNPRTESNHTADSAPTCPECGRPMARRKARSGKNAGREFWGCSGYPECKGVRDADREE